jgi:hypothetical protein
MGNAQRCVDKTTDLCNKISSKLIPLGCTLKHKPKTYVFIATWPSSSIGLRVSYPPDLNENAECDGWVIETSLYSDKAVIYDIGLGYEYVNRFFTPDELVAEITRVRIETTHVGFEQDNQRPGIPSDEEGVSDSDEVDPDSVVQLQPTPPEAPGNLDSDEDDPEPVGLRIEDTSSIPEAPGGPR